jgi:hypothetical protein
MRQVQSHRPPADALQRQADSTTTVGPSTFAVATGIDSLVHLGSEGNGSFDTEDTLAFFPCQGWLSRVSSDGAGRRKRKHSSTSA